MKELLFKVIKESVDEDRKEFSWEVFFRKWYRENGTAYFFLFKKNLGVTNMQYAELYSLLQLHCTFDNDSERKPELLFNQSETIKETIIEVINSVLDSREEHLDGDIEKFCNLYSEVFQSTVAVDLFFCSTAVFLPPGCSIDIEQVCADSGYIHSAGKSIFVRNIKKARSIDLFTNLDEYLLSEPDGESPFVVYAHEDFSGHDDDHKEEISKGLDTTKIYIEKMSMGAYRLADIVEDMRSKYAGRLVIPEPGSYRENQNFESKRTVWLICDRSLSSGSMSNAGRGRYYICYEQSLKNKNPLFWFDENKPAWKSHTTMPHSLTAALLNITRPFTDDIRICDPFGGTATTWIEAKRLNPNCKVESSDISNISVILAEDNIAFLLCGSRELAMLINEIKGFVTFVEKEIATSASSTQTYFENIQIEAEKGSSNEHFYKVFFLFKTVQLSNGEEDNEFVFSESQVQELRNLNFRMRIAFYLLLRARFRYASGFKRHSLDFKKALGKSSKELLNQLEKFVRFKAKFQKLQNIQVTDGYYLQLGNYSKQVLSSFWGRSASELLTQAKDEVQIRDAKDLVPNSLNIIICDPPYGFNTNEDQNSIAELYSGFLDSSIQALKKYGHLIISLPAESYTGRSLPYCTISSMVINQVLTKCKSHGRECINPATCLPLKEFASPYYWESEKALRRIILHFRVI